MRDKESGQFFDPEKMHLAQPQGKHFKVRGPLNMPRPPQGHPVIVQAGTSDDGMDVAARFAEVIFSAHLTIDSLPEVLRASSRRAPQDKFGRNPDHLKIMPGLSLLSSAAPRRRRRRSTTTCNSLMHPIVAREILSTVLGGVDLSPYRLRRPAAGQPADVERAARARSSTSPTWRKKDNLTMRQIAQVVAGARGKLVMNGTPQAASPTRWRSGYARRRPTASTSCRRTCPAGSTISSSW